MKTPEDYLRTAFGDKANQINQNVEFVKDYRFGQYPDSIQRTYIYKAMQDFSSTKEARIKELSEALESVWRLKDMIGYSDLQLAAHLGEAEAIEKMLHQVKQALNPPTDGSK